MRGQSISSHPKPKDGYSNSWITPRWVINSLPPFDLDPCASVPQPWPCAKEQFTESGLFRDWNGRVWLNPPYRGIDNWLRRLASHNNGIALLFARTETRLFFDEVWCKASGILFIKGRLYFHKPDGSKPSGNSGGPSCLVSYGEECRRILRDCNIEGAFADWETRCN